MGFLASLFVKAVTDVKERATYFAKLGDFLLKTALISFSASPSMRAVRKNEEKGEMRFLPNRGTSRSVAKGEKRKEDTKGEKASKARFLPPTFNFYRTWNSKLILNISSMFGGMALLSLQILRLTMSFVGFCGAPENWKSLTLAEDSSWIRS